MSALACLLRLSVTPTPAHWDVFEKAIHAAAGPDRSWMPCRRGRRSWNWNVLGIGTVVDGSDRVRVGEAITWMSAFACTKGFDQA
jgi:hypothetical protein